MKRKPFLTTFIRPAAQSALLFVICLGALGSLLANNYEIAFGNSDTLSAFMLVDDVLSDPSSLSDWYLPPSLYIVPDALLAAAVNLLQLSPAWQPVIYAAFMLLFVCFAGGSLYQAAIGGRWWPSVWLCAATLVTFFYWVAFCFGATVASRYYLTIFSADMHGGCLLLSIWAAAINFNFLKSDRKSWSHGGLLAISFLATLSDNLYLVWFTGPAVILALLDRQIAPRRSAILYATGLASSALAGMALSFLLNGATALQYQIDITVSPLSSLSALMALWQSWVRTENMPGLVILGLAVLLTCRSAQLVITLIRNRSLSDSQRLELFVGGAVVASIAAPILTGRFSADGHWRYLYPLLIYPAIWPLIALVKAPSKKAGLTTMAMLAMIAIAAGGKSWRNLEQETQPSALQICLELTGRRDGLADYWVAKQMRFLSDRRLRMIPVAAHGVPFRWIMNENWITEAQEHPPDFIVLKQLDSKALAEKFGMPDETLFCDRQEVWLYDHALRIQ